MTSLALLSSRSGGRLGVCRSPVHPMAPEPSKALVGPDPAIVRLVMPGAAEKKGEPSPHLEPALTLAFGSCPRGPQRRETRGLGGMVAA
mgnify:CR=1 FL=1